MPKYVVLYKLTDQGMRNICATVERARENKVASERRGFHILDIFWTLGQYDAVVVLEAPDETTMMAGLLNIAGTGNARCETLRAFTAEEMEQVLRKV